MLKYSPVVAGYRLDLCIIRQERRVMFSNADTAEEICREIGRRISLNRRSVGLPQEDLAARSGVAKRSVERLESGVANPRIDVLVRVCLAMGLASGFDRLLPEPELGPLALARGEKLPRRIRKHRKTVMCRAWKDGE